MTAGPPRPVPSDGVLVEVRVDAHNDAGAEAHSRSRAQHGGSSRCLLTSEGRDARTFRSLTLAWLAVGCGGDEAPPNVEPAWSSAARAEAAAFMSVHGTRSDDVWMVGADDGKGPRTSSTTTAPRGNARDGRSAAILRWVHAIDDGPAFFGGSDAHVLRFEDGVLERLSTPGLGKHTVFGIWAAAPDDAYVVGSVAGRNGIIWHYDGSTFDEPALPELPADEVRDAPGFFKVWGLSPEDVWVVGGNGIVLHGNARDGFELVRSGSEDEILFTVHGSRDKLAIVGGTSQGILLEVENGNVVDRTPAGAPLLQGVFVEPNGTACAVGVGGSIYEGKGDAYRPIDPGLDVAAGASLHSVWLTRRVGSGLREATY